MSALPTPPTDRTLRIVRVLAPIAAVAMATTVVVGLVAAPEGAATAFLDNVWGRVTVVDLYLALLATWVWIAWRDRNAPSAVVWAVLLITTGSVALWAYVAWRARSARDMQGLLVGQRDIGA